MFWMRNEEIVFQYTLLSGGLAMHACLKCVLTRDYHAVFWLSPEVSTRDPIISRRALARGVIMVEG